MKTFLYTISDFKENAIDCINLLLSSITFNIDVDFAIVSNKTPSQSIKYNIVFDDSIQSEYIGQLKYSKKIPQNYDYYIYLDSDILYFDQISKLIDTTKAFTIVRENYKIQKNPWHYFQYAPEKDKSDIINAEALNAGSFAFSASQYSAIEEMYDLCTKYYKNDIYHDVRLEQCIYNYVIHKATQFNLNHCHDITGSVELFASNKNKIPNKSLYHFCGFDNTMKSKITNMRTFYDKYFQ
jgi:hypothetical protein